MYLPASTWPATYDWHSLARFPHSELSISSLASLGGFSIFDWLAIGFQYREGSSLVSAGSCTSTDGATFDSLANWGLDCTLMGTLNTCSSFSLQFILDSPSVSSEISGLSGLSFPFGLGALALVPINQFPLLSARDESSRFSELDNELRDGFFDSHDGSWLKSALNSDMFFDNSFGLYSEAGGSLFTLWSGLFSWKLKRGWIKGVRLRLENFKESSHKQTKVSL